MGKVKDRCMQPLQVGYWSPLSCIAMLLSCWKLVFFLLGLYNFQWNVMVVFFLGFYHRWLAIMVLYTINSVLLILLWIFIFLACHRLSSLSFFNLHQKCKLLYFEINCSFFYLFLFYIFLTQTEMWLLLVCCKEMWELIFDSNPETRPKRRIRAPTYLKDFTSR